MSEVVKIVEVGPRDGLQNETIRLSAQEKVQLIRHLKNTGLTHIEAGAFVSSKAVPQMADSTYVMEGLSMFDEGLHLPVLVPNLKGYERAIAAGVKEVAVFASASETFSQKNINCSIEESFGRFLDVFEKAKDDGVKVRGYVSCVAGCPYEGKVSSGQILHVVEKLSEMGAYEISLGDTIGVANPAQIKRLVFDITSSVPMSKIALHLHDTYGQAIANIYAGLEVGVRTFDSSVGGLGGCPYAPGSSGNVATEDVVYLMNGLGYATGIDLDMLVRVAWHVSELLGREPISKVARAMGR
jgi:hydroxymethylglutaryl-CoA lyase